MNNYDQIFIDSFGNKIGLDFLVVKSEFECDAKPFIKRFQKLCLKTANTKSHEDRKFLKETAEYYSTALKNNLIDSKAIIVSFSKNFELKALRIDLDESINYIYKFVNADNDKTIFISGLAIEKESYHEVEVADDELRMLDGLMLTKYLDICSDELNYIF